MAEKNEKSAREPLFHIVKRDGLPWWKGWLIRAAAVAAAFVVCSIVSVILTGENPFAIFSSMFAGAFGTERKIWTLLREIAVLLCISLAVTPAFKMRFWNIGAEGQVLAGGLAAAACMFYLGGKVPDGVIVVLTIVCSMLAGGIWAVIPAIFKAKWNTNETLFTLMMNYIAIQLVAFFINTWVTSGSGTLGLLKYGHLPVLGNDHLLTIIVAAVLTALLYVYLKFSKHGYEISVVGESVNTARYVGINVKKVVIRTMALSGALCGIAGLLLVGGIHHTLSVNTAGGRGFTAIMVSWLGKFNPAYMVLTSFLVVFLQQGSSQICTDFRLNASFPEIITGIIFFFIIGCEFFIGYRIKKNRAKKKEGAAESAMASVGTEEEDLSAETADGAKEAADPPEENIADKAAGDFTDKEDGK